jgi:hypothetical protein
VRVRLTAVAAIAAALALALGIRVLITGGGIVNSSPALAQYSGTALYAVMTYAAVYVVAPRTRPWTAAAVALTFCWLVEFFQMTGVPARLSDHSLLARLALGRAFDASDLLWYAAGILPVAVVHALVRIARPSDAAATAQRTTSTATAPRSWTSAWPP